MSIVSPNPCYFIAEAGVNHNGDVELGFKLIDAAAAAGADAVKFQSFNAEFVVTPTAPKARYQTHTTDGDGDQFNMLKRLELTPDDHRRLIAHCKARSITFLSTPFDYASADLLEELGVELFKIPSGEITNTPFLEFIASKGLPIVLSTGMADLNEVAKAVCVIKKLGHDNLTLLHCVSEYPAPPEEANLLAMKTMADKFNLPVGYSDHTPGIEVSICAAALGATIIEKHFTLSRSLPGPDHAASVEPDELKKLVKGIKIATSSRGTGVKNPTETELENAKVIRRSMVALINLSAGTVLKRDHVGFKRPATGLSPSCLKDYLGRKLIINVPASTTLKAEMFDD